MQRLKRSPMVSSVDALLALAAGIMAISLGGMTLYAGSHLHNADAPLQPAAATAAPAAKTTTSSTTGRLQLSRGVATTTTLPITRTHRS